MVIEKGVEAMQVAQGFVAADVKVKTDRGVVGMRVSFELRKNPDLITAVEMLEDAIHELLEKNLGMVPVENGTLGAPVKDEEPVGDPVH